MAVNIWESVNTWLGGGGGDVPPLSRGSYYDISSYLKTQGFTGTTNEIIFKWLVSEGVAGTQFNELFNNYWEGLGYTGAYNDKWKKWKDS